MAGEGAGAEGLAGEDPEEERLAGVGETKRNDLLGGLRCVFRWGIRERVRLFRPRVASARRIRGNWDPQWTGFWVEQVGKMPRGEVPLEGVVDGVRVIGGSSPEFFPPIFPLRFSF